MSPKGSSASSEKSESMVLAGTSVLGTFCEGASTEVEEGTDSKGRSGAGAEAAALGSGAPNRSTS